MKQEKKQSNIDRLSKEGQEHFVGKNGQADEVLTDYRALFEKMPSGFAINRMITDESGNPIDFIILDFNQAFGKIFELARGVIGKKASEVFPGLSADLVMKLATVLQSGQPATFSDFTFDSVRYFELNVFSTSPEIFAFSLKESGKVEKLQYLTEHSTNVFFSHTTDHLLTYLSPQIEKLLGYAAEDTGLKWTDFLSKNPINKLGIELTERAIATGQVQEPFELELVHKNGSRVWVEVRQAPVVENGQTTSVVGALIDITEQKKIAAQLLANEKGFRNLIDESPTAIAVNSKQGDIEYVNYEFTKTFGYTLNDIPHTDQWFVLAYPDEDYRKEVKRLWKIDLEKRLKHGAPKNPFEVRITCKDGSVKFVQIMWSYIGERLVLIFYDLTKHKTLEEQIIFKNDELQNALNELKKINEELEKATQKAKESDQLKSAFLANMSHEIRTPMNSIIGFSSLLSLPGTNAEKRKRYTEFIQKSGKHLLRIIDDIIDVAKIESNQLKIAKSFFSVVPFLESTYDFHRQDPILTSSLDVQFLLDTKLAPGTIIIFTDPTRLKQVFDNLLTNSIKNTSKGFIKFGIHQIEENHITFYVADTGIGIPEKFKESVFMRFTQAETKTIKPGTGLGLSIIKGITQLLDGEIWFESTENVGTTFYVKFPIQPEE